ncbi:MAG: noncanonical pyrimidine nucleotidase, YjjG family [Flavobacteriales bacterium]|nr:MAG: noncanonical pyrimidine nucleotidase, YjjG family [Flavobacteriales bacterium]
MKKEYEHIFFDLDRTLWHFDENSKKVLNDIYNKFELNKSIRSVDCFISKYQEINENLWNLYRDDKVSKEELRWKRFGDTLKYFSLNDNKMAIEIGDYYIIYSPRQTLLFPNTIEVLDYLSKKYQMHIITNGFEEVQYTKLTKSGLLNYFDVIILSEKVGVKKPHPYIFKKAFLESGADAKNSIMIGDDLYADIYGAQRVKMDHVYFNYYNTPHNKKVQYEINCLRELYEIL